LNWILLPPVFISPLSPVLGVIPVVVIIIGILGARIITVR